LEKADRRGIVDQDVEMSLKLVESRNDALNVLWLADISSDIFVLGAVVFESNRKLPSVTQPDGNGSACYLHEQTRSPSANPCEAPVIRAYFPCSLLMR